jgi:hypothetical protein
MTSLMPLAAIIVEMAREAIPVVVRWMVAHSACDRSGGGILTCGARHNLERTIG